MENVDVVVIGSGHNGLVSAFMLAEKGFRVLVLEKADLPGGASKSVEANGFVHDLYAMNIGLFLGSQFYEEYKEELLEHGFEPVVSDHPYASVFPDGTGLGIYQDREKTYQTLSAFSQGDADSWVRLNDYFDQTAPYFMPLMQMELPSFEAGKQFWKMYRHFKISGLLQLGSQLLQSPREFVDRWFTEKKMKSLIVPWGFHLDFAPDVSNGAVFPFLESVLNQRNGMAFSRGGIGQLMNSLIKGIEKRGGVVRTGADVDEILVEDGKAVGVKLTSGEIAYAKKAVIGNVTPTQLITRLLDQKKIDSSYVEKAKNYQYGPGTMMVHLELDSPLEWKAGEEYGDFAYIHIGPYVEDLSRTYTQSLNGVLPNSPLLVVGQPTTIDASRAPEGKHTLWIQVRALPASVKEDSLGEIAPGGWEDIKEAYAERVLDKLAHYAPNVREVLSHKIVLSPGDLEADNPNLVGGDSVSGSHHLHQNYAFRPVPGYSRYHTPIKNLYMVGAATWPGGGLNATSGYLLAHKLT
ncbi:MULTISPECIES: phytoene desaturase family protein [Pontibacillus]|uniref:Pyridine nucleotide-disulfide oxidoreductase domain-containing protein 2 n=1 Tax=Pontibacillus chungwhensis TaxID=265426 RepID=A0ABY8UYM3_9BACI|nr:MULTISPECIES: NAD(P)/FAD-dependent oxidoreductase [Pontibacillus]MCD5325924.1 NAD(P)/FAD-dependent oxidoreductase [Pontibacillus sp. HN14]WIF97634.1 NAD(P)/FAD-dependent oxidoreductase [Pontibacillus chungwhensis]